MYDVIVIGAGLGGLTAGAKLAKEGKKVLVLEQHDRPGGCATTFERKGYTMEVGLHEMDGPHARDMKVRIFKDLGLTEKIGLLKVPEFYRFYNGRYDVVIPHDPEEAVRKLIALFPGEEKGIRVYFEAVLNPKKYLTESQGRPDLTVGDFLDEHIGNEDLKLILLGNLGYFHDDPYSFSLNYYLVAQGSYYGGGASFIRGGSQQLSNALMDLINSKGGNVLLNCRATGILFEGGKAAGVKYLEGKGKNAKEKRVEASIVIVNASVPALAEELLPMEQGGRLSSEIRGIRTGASLLTVYYGFKKSLKEVGNRYYSQFVYDASVKTQKDILSNNHDHFERRSFTLVDYSQVDSGLAPEGKGVGAVCCIDYAEDWEGMERKAYLQKKDEVAEVFTRRCEELIPGFSEAVEYCEVGTPLTVRRYTGNPGGSVYGFAQNPGRSMSYLNALPPNVYLASAWGKFGGGFSGAIYSGYMTGVEVLRGR